MKGKVSASLSGKLVPESNNLQNWSKPEPQKSISFLFLNVGKVCKVSVVVQIVCTHRGAEKIGLLGLGNGWIFLIFQKNLHQFTHRTLFYVRQMYIFSLFIVFITYLTIHEYLMHWVVEIFSVLWSTLKGRRVKNVVDVRKILFLWETIACW